MSAGLFALLVGFQAAAAKLTPDKTEIEVGETTLVRLEADPAPPVGWETGPELAIVDSSGKGVIVKGVKPGSTSVTAKYPTGRKSIRLLVREAVQTGKPAPRLNGVTLVPYPQNMEIRPLPLADAAAGIVLAKSTTLGSAPVDAFQVMREMAGRGPVTPVQAREFFQRVQTAAGPGGNLWRILRETKRANLDQWSAVRAVENQLVALVRDALVGGREQVIRRGGLGTVLAFLDSGTWRGRAPADLDFDTDFDTIFFADRLADVDPEGRDNVINRVEDMLRDRLGVGSGHLGIKLAGFGQEAPGDGYVTQAGIKWVPREPASHMHLIDPLGGRIGQNVAQFPNLLFAHRRPADLRRRHPELFDAGGRLLPDISRAAVRRILRAEPGLARGERMFAEGTAANLADAALAPMDMACHLTETRPSANTGEDTARIGRQVALATTMFIEGMGGGEAGQQPFTPAERDFMQLIRNLEAAKIDQAATEAEISRFVAGHPDPSAWTEAEAAPLDRLIERARGHRTTVERGLTEIRDRWPAESVRQIALAVLKKQAGAGFDANLRHLLGRDAGERARALGDFAREMETLVHHYENPGVPAEMQQWVRGGLETGLILSEMARDPRFPELWTAFGRMSRAEPRDIPRLKELLGKSEAGQRLLARIGAVLDRIVNPPGQATLGHPVADAGRGLRPVAGAYTALLAGLLDAANRAGSDAEFAAGVAQTLVGTASASLIAREGQPFAFAGDHPAAIRLVGYLLAPEATLADMVEALGHSTVHPGVGVAFDTQLDALWRLSQFDDQGALQAIGGHPRGRLPEMIATLLGAGGDRPLQEMLDKTAKGPDSFLAEQAGSVTPDMKQRALHALAETLIAGNHLAFRDDATLAAHCGNLRRYAEEIRYVAGVFKIAVPETATAADFHPAGNDPGRQRPNAPGWAAGLDAGQLRVLARLLVSRDAWRARVRQAFLASLIGTLETRHRAEQDAAARLRGDKRGRLLALFDELDIRDPGVTAYAQETGYHLSGQNWNPKPVFASSRERAAHEMKALDRYLDVYHRVRERRTATEAEIVRRAGKSALPRPLTSSPALTGVPAIDGPAAEQLADAVGQLGDMLYKTLAAIKQAPLEGDYDGALLARLHGARYLDLYWTTAMRSTASLGSQAAAWKAAGKTAPDALQAEAGKRSREAATLAHDLIEEFRAHYAPPVIRGEVRVSPRELAEGDRFTATVVLTQGSPPKGARWTWEGSGGVKVQGDGDTAAGSVAAGGSLRARLLDTAGKALADLAVPLDARPICDHDYSEWGECSRSTKKQARLVTAKRPAGCVERRQPALEQGCVPPPTEAERRDQYFNCLCRCSGDWAGHIGVWYDPERLTAPTCQSAGPCIGGIGATDCSSRHYLSGPDDCAKGCWESAWGKGSYDPVKADTLRKDENRKFKRPPTVKIRASKNPADFGDSVELAAETAEGSGGYRWNWGGCAQDARGANARVTGNRDCKPCDASVTVTDQDGDSATDALSIQCTALKVTLSKESPRDNAIPVGGKANFLAEVHAGDKPAGGTYFYDWGPNPDALYGDPDKPSYQTRGGSRSRNAATFRKPGNTPVWVNVFKEVAGGKLGLGESTRIPIEVVSPKLTLTVDKPTPLVGETVILSVHEEPKLSDELLAFRWEIAGDATHAGPVANIPNSRAYSYRPVNDKPVTVGVHAKSRDGGDALGAERLTITARKPSVTVSGPRLAGPAPMIWKEGVGLVAAERQVAEGRRVDFSVAVSPDPGQDLRYQWAISPDGCSLHAATAKETGVTCDRTGGYTLTVTVKNADGAELGSGAGSLNVTVSRADIDAGGKKADAVGQLDQARQLWSQGRHDEAVARAEAAALLDTGLAAPVLAQFSQGLKTQGWDALNQADHPTAIRRLEQAVRLNPTDPDAGQKLGQARDHAAKWPRVEAMAREFDGLLAAKKLWSAQRAMLALQDSLRGMAAGQSPENPVWKRVTADFRRGVEDYNRYSQEKSARHARHLKEENFEAMLRDAESMGERELSPADEKEARSRIDFARHFLGAAEFARQARSLTAQGQHDQALAAVLKGRGIHPRSVETAARELADSTRRLGREAETRRDFQASGRLFDIARKAMPQDNDAHIGADNAPVYQKRGDEVRARLKETEGLIANGDWDQSESRLEEIKRLEAAIPGEWFPETRSLIERQKQGYAAYKAEVEPRKQEIGKLLDNQCLDKARAGVMAMRGRQLIGGDQDWTRSSLETIDEAQRTCSLGGVPLKNHCGRDCGGVSGSPAAGAGPAGSPVSPGAPAAGATSAGTPAAGQDSAHAAPALSGAASGVPAAKGEPSIEQQMDELLDILKQLKALLGK